MSAKIHITQLFRIIGNQDLSRALVRQILREIEITPEEFIDLLKKV